MDDTRGVPLVTIAIPCLNEEGHILRCLEDVFAQDYPETALEVLVADGGSRDRTRELLREASERWPGRLRVIDNPRRIQASAMNAMIREARGDIVVRMDVHARYAHDYVRQCVSVLEETNAANVGGAQRAAPSSRFQQALCAALRSPLAVGGARYRSADAEGFVDTVFLGAFRRRTLEELGGYDSNAITNEDAELNQRILEAGGTIYLSRRIVVHYSPRASYGALARQYFRYGKGRARTLLKHGRLPTPRPAGPFLLVTAAASILARRSWRPFAPYAFGLYGVIAIVEAARVSLPETPLLAPLVATIFPVLHVSHGVGFAAGLVHYALHPDWSERREAIGGIAST
jgi:cellulose synthase/poly-beta-1,6-N-acetylglucosamine synthase-like glycosyltransferase